jgi:hypothetical protein
MALGSIVYGFLVLAFVPLFVSIFFTLQAKKGCLLLSGLVRLAGALGVYFKERGGNL